MTVRFADSAGKKVVIPPPHLLFALFYPICKWPFSALSRFFPSIKLTYPLTRSAENHVGRKLLSGKRQKAFSLDGRRRDRQIFFTSIISSSTGRRKGRRGTEGHGQNDRTSTDVRR